MSRSQFRVLLLEKDQSGLGIRPEVAWA